MSVPIDEITGKGKQVLCIVWILLSISTVLVGLRVFIKLKVTRKLWWDDWFVLLAAAWGYCHAVFVTISIEYGLGHHMNDFAIKAQLSETLRWGYYSFGPAFISPMFGRISFCVFLLSLVWQSPNIPRWPLYICIAMQVAINCISVILMYGQCGSHLSAYWRLDVGSIVKYCLNYHFQSYWGYAAGTINTLTDLLLTVLPVVIVSFSRLNFKHRLGLTGLMCLSLVAMCASIKKTMEAKMLSEWMDYTYVLCEYISWGSIELNVVICTSTVPLLRPLFRKNGLSRVDTRGLRPGTGHDSTRSFSKGGSVRSMGKGNPTDLQALSVSSEEDILVHPHRPLEIMRTVEVSVSHDAPSWSAAHAALIGLPLG